MATVKDRASRATLIGDVVGSRRIADRSAQHPRLLNQALRDVAADAIDPPAFTVGDEFQGSYPTVGSAIDAALSVRLAVAPGIDVRFGIGWGSVTMLDADRRHPGRPGLVGGPRGHRMDGFGAAADRAWRWYARHFGPRRIQDRRRRDQCRADVSGPPAWIAR